MHVILKEVWYITLKVMWAKKNEAIIWFKRLNWKSMNNSKWIYNSNLVYVTTWWEHWCGTLTHFSSVPMKMWGEIESLISSCMAVIDSLGKNLSFRKCWHCVETENTQFNSKHHSCIIVHTIWAFWKVHAKVTVCLSVLLHGHEGVQETVHGWLHFTLRRSR